jgi:flavin reductase (DIM6/NTAB) family NADH-FMN oxidoreductase RutF
MAKVTWRPGTMVYPVPAVMVSCGKWPVTKNIITIAWTGTICSDPAMCYISVRKERFSHGLIKDTGDFVINLTNAPLAYATDWCGVKSGRDTDKFEAMGLTAIQATRVKSPMIAEAPVNIECQVVEIKELGSHDMFLANVVAVNASHEHLHPEKGSLDLASARMITYMHGNYYHLGKPIGKFGWSVEKKKRKK